MCKDLDFEIPHKIRKEDIKDKLIEEITSEETRLKDHTKEQTELENQAKERLKLKSKGYENYFNILPNYNTDILSGEKEKLSEGAGRNMKKYVKFEDFIKQFSNKFMFDNDLLYESYYYWEDLDEKENRLRELWINSMKVKLERAAKNPKYHLKDINILNEEISDLVRNLRRKIDQTLLKNKKHPIFGANYRYYKRDEFTLDSEVEFHKIKKFLDESPDMIKKDPEIGVKYDELKTLLKRKVVKERVSVKFGNENEDVYYRSDEKMEDEEEIGEAGTSADFGDEATEQGIITKKGIELEIKNAVGTPGNADKVEKDLGKVKNTIISHFENILKEKGESLKKDKKGTASQFMAKEKSNKK
jgi:hypothetical protein